MSYGTKPQVEHYYSVHPTVVDVDNDLRRLSDAQIERLAMAGERDILTRKPWENLTVEERRAYRALEAQAVRERKAKQKAERDEEARKHQAEQDKRVAAEVEAFKRSARAAFPGTDAEFEKAFPSLLARWREDETLRRMDDLRNQVRRRIGAF